MHPLSIARFTAILLAVGAPAGGATLDVRITGLKTTDGQLRVALFAGEADYAAGKMLAGSVIDAAAPSPGAVFAGLAPGAYALKVFHDRNGNGRLDVNMLGVPIEPYAFSNAAIAHDGPAEWADARFTVKDDTVVQTVTVD